MRGILNACIDILFPPSEDVMHVRTLREENVVEKINFKESSAPHIITALEYRDPSVRALVRANKFNNDHRSATLLAAVLFETLIHFSEMYAFRPEWQRPFIVPIPSSPRTRRVRGANQVERIIQALPKGTVRRYHPDILMRHTRNSQSHLTKGDRSENIRDAFFVPAHKKHLITDTSILLIDDVSETGSTMKDAMRALKEAGARHITGVALAK